MREGEVADDAAVTEAVGRLRDEVGLKKVAVRLGLASPRVVVRQIEMPVMTREELASALQFQAAELIPIPLDDAVLDFAILGPASPGDGGEPRMQVLLAAAQEATVLRLVAAVEAGGLQVACGRPRSARADPSARSPASSPRRRGCRRSIATAPAWAAQSWPTRASGAEGIVSFGGGVTAIAVHEIGVPRFVRVLGTGGRELTDAIASRARPAARDRGGVEASARRPADPRHDELVARAAHVDRAAVVGAARRGAQLDRLLPQPARFVAAAAHRRDRWRRAASGTAPNACRRSSAYRSSHARPRELVALGDIGFADDELPRLDPYLPAAGRSRARWRGRRLGHRPHAAHAAQRGHEATQAAVAEGRRRRCRVRGGARRRHVHGAPERVERQGGQRQGHQPDHAGASDSSPRCSRSSTGSNRSRRSSRTCSSLPRHRRRVADDDRTASPPSCPPGVTFTSFQGQITPPAPVVGDPATGAPSTSRVEHGDDDADNRRRRRRPHRPSRARSRSRERRRTSRRSRPGSTRWARSRRSRRST